MLQKKMGWQDWYGINMNALVTWEGQALFGFWYCVFHGTWNEWSDVSKNLFCGSACSTLAFPDWARVKCRQQRFLEHYDEAKPPWGSWAILLFKVWTGAAFICHCILLRLSVLLFVLLYSTQFPSTLWFWWPNTWISVLLECICHHLTFFLSSFLSLYPGKQGQRPNRLPFWMSHVMRMKVLYPVQWHHWNLLTCLAWGLMSPTTSVAPFSNLLATTFSRQM